MSEAYRKIMSGIEEIIEDLQGGQPRLTRRTVSIEPVKTFGAADVKRIRTSTGFSQSLFAGYLGVSVKTVEAWEAGTNRPSGAASRLLSMIESDADLVKRFPFVTAE